jgi:hypothetical protein
MNKAIVEPLQADYNNHIKQDTELYLALQQATADLAELVEKHGLPPATRELNWASSISSPPELITAHLAERDKYGDRQANSTAKRSKWLDPVSREQLLIWLMLNIRKKLWYQMDKCLDELIDQMEQEEQEHA